MTNKQAIELLKWFGEYNDIDYHGGDMIENDKGDRFYRVVKEDLEAFDMAIKALSQQTEDAISRQAVLDRIKESVETYHNQYTTDMLNMWGLFTQFVKEMPPITPKQETAHWKWLRNDVVMCDKCGYVQTLVDFDEDKRGKNYCPSCGRKMEDEE